MGRAAFRPLQRSHAQRQNDSPAIFRTLKRRKLGTPPAAPGSDPEQSNVLRLGLRPQPRTVASELFGVSFHLRSPGEWLFQGLPRISIARCACAGVIPTAGSTRTSLSPCITMSSRSSRMTKDFTGYGTDA